MFWAAFAGHIVILRRGVSDGWLLLALVAVVFSLGLFATWVALRGSNKTVDDFNLIP